ncbi:Hsp20/alpha crystallin family protein [uncultured delta proteobacterium]|uniref:Hsp20/alpha crystallin family protein n=1 Tax=uncultured delta proteobacterium TaxID=34034 RepID=A0A212KHL5_9DELT|nr:Hsp20/alpha crystallin family protein [uncultured delta proteobacterium]
MVIDFNSLYEMPKEMDRILEMFRNSSAMQRRNSYPMVNVGENDTGYIVDVCIPGVSIEDLDLTLTARSLVIKAERKSPEGRYFRQERLAGSFQRIITLNVPVARDKVTAKCENGILRVTLPKEEEIKPHRISIEQ